MRWGLAEQLGSAFMLGLPVLAVVFVATFFIPHTPLRETTHDHPVQEAGQEVLDAYGSESAGTDSRSAGVRLPTPSGVSPRG